jgi:AraC-like DNA-binding protein
MKNTFQPVKKIISKSVWYEEETILSSPAVQGDSLLLDILAFGHSLFKAGAVLPISTGAWVIQYQLSGTAEIRSDEGNYLLRPGDLLIIPPRTAYTYRVPEHEDMQKYFIIMRTGPLPEMLLGEAVRQYGMKVSAGQDCGIREILEKTGSLFENMKLETSEELSVLLYNLLVKIRNIISENSSDRDFHRNLLRAADVFRAKKCSLEDLAGIFKMNKHSLIREFKRRTGKTPVAYMIQLRLDTACQLLTLSSMTISEIAAFCGYSTPSFFISDFKKQTGLTPGKFRQEHKKSLK